MKRVIFMLRPSLLLFLPLVMMAAPDHLVFTELVMEPSTAEYVIINNPTGDSVSLSNYYITDATDTNAGKYYYNLPSGVDFWSESAFDFIARFPDTTLASGETVILCFDNESDYDGDIVPDLWLAEDMYQAVDGETTIGSFPVKKLDTSAETLILFYWDGLSSTVQDVDYLLWGDNSFAIDKSGVSGYADDTPAADQSFMPVHVTGQKLIRSNDEGSETSVGGNGITGHDETSEDLANTWAIVDLTIVKPVISDISYSPESPGTADDITITAEISDSTGLTSVILTYNFPAGVDPAVAVSMSNTSEDTYEAVIPATGAEGTLAYFIQATNSQGLTETSEIKGIVIEDPPPPLTIQTIRENLDDYLGETVSINAVVSIGSGVIRTDRTSMYIQDNSGYGININQSGLLSPALVKGDSIYVTGTVGEYTSSTTGDYTVQLSDITYDLLAQDRPVPNIQEVTSEEINSLELEGTYVKVWGIVQSRSDDIGGGSNIAIEDSYGLLTVRVWDTTNLLADETADSLLQVGNLVDIYGVAGSYRLEGQLLAAYPEDIQEHREGEDSDGGTRLLVAPYPFVPQLGEKIEYRYKFPANSRITLRVFDISGRMITTLFEDYRSLALEVVKTWNGRNELNELVPAGTYIMHLETVNRSNGELKVDMAPVVIGSVVK